MLIAVDGTGPFFNKDTKIFGQGYESSMAKSFVKILHSQHPDPAKFYYRGPSVAGLETAPTARQALGEIIKIYKSQKQNFKLFLTGYSRGGACVIHLANLLQLELPRVKVDCMILFDAVNRSPAPELTPGAPLLPSGIQKNFLIPFGSVDRIPNNVKFVYHAVRDPKNESRWYFGNCGMEAIQPTKFFKKVFNATHAGLGGMPWTGDKPMKAIPNPKFNWSDWRRKSPLYPPPPELINILVPTITKAEDDKESDRVQKWMWDNMKRHGML